MPTNDYDVIVVGARSAGAPTAMLLARSGHRVLLVDRSTFPSDTVSTHLVHPPGGVVGGDRLELRVVARGGSHSLITTPSATKFYRSEGRVARQSQDISLDAACFEWLPQETILFPDAYANIATRVRLTERSRFIGWEIVCYGRPASGLLYSSGQAHQDFELWMNDAPVVLDHLRLDGSSNVMHARFGLSGFSSLGTMFASGNAGVAGLVAICLYLTGLGMSFGPIIWILMSEIFPAPIRAQAMSTAIAAQWSANFLVSGSFPMLFDESFLAVMQGGFAFFVYGTFSLLACFLVLKHVPETKGLDPELLGAFWRRHTRIAAATP